MLDITATELSGKIADTEPALLPLSVDGLVYELNGVRIIDGITLHIEPTGCTAIMGYNGAGKSVLVRLLHGLLTPTAGACRWAGDFSASEISRRQSMVFQEPVLLRRSVEANIDYALRKRGFKAKDRSRKLEAILRETNLLKLRKRPASVLSSGERQRVALCRALAVEPELVFLDEPTASLDPAVTVTIEQILLRGDQCRAKIDHGESERWPGAANRPGRHLCAPRTHRRTHTARRISNDTSIGRRARVYRWRII